MRIGTEAVADMASTSRLTDHISGALHRVAAVFRRSARHLPALGTARLIRVLGVVVGITVPSYLVLDRSSAAFTAQTTNGVNTFAAGSIALTDDDSASAMFTMSGMYPGNIQTKCITVTYTSSVNDPSNIRLYASQTVAPLSPYLNVVIEDGSISSGGGFPGCGTFTVNASLFTGTLQTLISTNTSFATGLGSWNPATTGTRSYRVTVTLADNNAAQGLSANATLTWEAQTA